MGFSLVRKHLKLVAIRGDWVIYIHLENILLHQILWLPFVLHVQTEQVLVN